MDFWSHPLTVGIVAPLVVALVAWAAVGARKTARSIQRMNDKIAPLADDIESRVLPWFPPPNGEHPQSLPEQVVEIRTDIRQLRTDFERDERWQSRISGEHTKQGHQMDRIEGKVNDLGT